MAMTQGQQSHPKFLAPLGLMLLLTACGGGGGGGAQQPPPNQPPTADAGSDLSQVIQPTPITLDGSSFHASADPDVDMTYAGSLPQHFPIQWADHSTERNEWAVVTNDFENDFGEVSKLSFYTDQHLNEVSLHDLARIPTSHNGGAATSAARIFHTQDGSQVILILNGNGLLNSFAVQVTDR